MGLFEELAHSFPSEVVSPYGEVLIIPCKAFKSEWKESLEAEGVKIYSQGFNGEMCFFLKKGNPNAEVEVQPLNFAHKTWSETEIAELLRLRSEGLSYREIAKRMGRSLHSIYHKSKLLQKQQADNKVSETSETKTEPKLNDDVVKELLSACSLLYPSHKRACKLLLEQDTRQV